MTTWSVGSLRSRRLAARHVHMRNLRMLRPKLTASGRDLNLITAAWALCFRLALQGETSHCCGGTMAPSFSLLHR